MEVQNMGTISGYVITGNNNVINQLAMSEKVNEILINLAQSQITLSDAVATSLDRSSEADLIRAKAQMLEQENKRIELQLRENEINNTEKLINGIQLIIEKIELRLL